jgi:hypothetical protein
MGKLYVFSTLTAAQEYTGWIKGAGDLPRKKHSVTINGGANLYSKSLITPKGTVTEIDEEDLAFLRTNKVFLAHEKNGYIKVESRRRDVEAAVSDMEHRDESAPDTPDDFVDQKIDTGHVMKVNVRGRGRPPRQASPEAAP